MIDPIDLVMQQGNTHKGSDVSSNTDVTFEEFTTPSYDDWHKEAEAALKGADFDKSLIKKQIEGFSTQPIYRAEDTVKLSESVPGQYPYLRGTKALGYQEKSWEVAQTIAAKTPADFNERARYDLERGQTALNITLGCKCGCGLVLRTAADWAEALKGIAIDTLPVYVNPGSNGLAALGMYVNEFSSRGLSVDKMTGGMLYDPLARLVSKGKLNCSLENAYDQMAEMTKWAKENTKSYQTIGVSSIPYNASGSDAVQEVAFSLATAVEYLRAMTERGLTVDEAAPRIRFSVALGPNFFMEIAKLRALRQLWASVVTSCGGSKEAAKINLHGRTSSWTVTKVDPWVNILRGTSQAFSGVVGGVDSLDVIPFDAAVRPSDEPARRLARNTQLILQGECDLDKVVDPAGGSWYIETLTTTVGQAAWKMFQEIESAGGASKSLFEGALQARVDKTAAKRYELIDQRRQSLVGINKYTNLGEKSLEPVILSEPADGCAAKVELDGCTKTVCCAAKAASKGASLCQIGEAISGDTQITAPALTKRHASERFERLLDKAASYQAQTGSRPAVFFANMGPLRQFKARADFSQDFLRAGGFDCVYTAGFQTAADAAKAALESGLGACVICSTDDTYPDYVADFCAAVKAAKPDMAIMLAGYPKDKVEEFAAAGVDMFIHIKANCYETLATLQSKLGL